ncbi:MAG TPA: hypothetical protein VGB08_08125 [Allosphingosinicella sp.]|jgi:hypothetical protein
MTDDEDGLPRAGSEFDRDLLLYDYFKHLTSLVLLTLGGMLFVMKDFDPTDVKPQMVIIAIVLISLSGVLAFGGSAEIVRAKYENRPTKWSLALARFGSPALLSVGFGLFLAMFIDSLTR